MRILDVETVASAEAGSLTPHLIQGEVVHAAFASPTGSVLFTERRILLAQREHLLEEKIETSSWPYREVRHFSIQEGSGGRCTIRIWLGAEPQPLHLRAAEGSRLAELQQLLAEKLA
jgi:hypothetical protein